ncbi:MAG: hypothetical protein NC918_07170, partial [Candidatus Omnitrophica bacterium]|nr:hypothetical protein [Candidatus Omnitrophota bacterium]
MIPIQITKGIKLPKNSFRNIDNPIITNIFKMDKIIVITFPQFFNLPNPFAAKKCKIPRDIGIIARPIARIINLDSTSQIRGMNGMNNPSAI